MWLAGEHWDGLVSGDCERSMDVDAWYDGAVSVEGGLEVDDMTWSSSFDGSAVRDTLSLTVTDRLGNLVTEKATSPLAPYGQLVIARAVAALTSGKVEESVPVGTFVIDGSTPSYEWGWHEASGRLFPTGGKIQVAALDCLADLVEAQFSGPSAPRGTVAAEMQTLTRGYVGVDLTGVPTTTVPASVTYGDSKWDAIKDLAASVGLVPAPGRDGTLRFRSPVVGTPVWTATSSERSIMSASLVHSREGLINQVLGTGEQDADGVSPVRALAQETSGPFRAGGPLKEKLRRHSSPFYRTYAQALNGATSILSRSIRDRTLRIPFECRWNPALDVLDTITIEYDPTLDPVPALVVSLQAGMGAATMSGEAIVSRGVLG